MTTLNATEFAVIADVHGNVDALLAVLDDIDAQGINDIVNLGDHFSGPLAAAETAEVLRARPMICVRGNHARWLCDQRLENMGVSDAAAYVQLSAEDLGWLRGQAPRLELAEDIFACHATPQDDLTYWLEHVSEDGSVGARPWPDVAGLAGGIGASLSLCAHTHIQRRGDLPDGRVILNPGSVGCPAFDDDTPVYHVVESGTPAACYAIIERSAAGWRSTFHQVPLGHWGEITTNGKSLRFPTSLGGPHLLTLSRLSPRSPAPCRKSISGKVFLPL